MPRGEWRFESRPDQLPRARAALRAWLQAHRVPEEVATDALLVATELVTNGIVHGGGAITVRAEATDDDVLLEVVTLDLAADEHPWLDVRTGIDGGRGLRIVRALTRNLAIRCEGPVRTVSCSLPGPPGARS